MKAIKSRAMATVLAVSLLTGSVAFAAQSELYSSLKGYLIGLVDQYLNRESALTQTGQQNQAKLQQTLDTLTADITKELDAYEQEQVNQAKAQLEAETNQVVSQLQQDKQQIIEEAKRKIEDKVKKDLEKELSELSKVKGK